MDRRSRLCLLHGINEPFVPGILHHPVSALNGASRVREAPLLTGSAASGRIEAVDPDASGMAEATGTAAPGAVPPGPEGSAVPGAVAPGSENSAGAGWAADPVPKAGATRQVIVPVFIAAAVSEPVGSSVPSTRAITTGIAPVEEGTSAGAVEFRDPAWTGGAAPVLPARSPAAPVETGRRAADDEPASRAAAAWVALDSRSFQSSASNARVTSAWVVRDAAEIRYSS